MPTILEGYEAYSRFGYTVTCAGDIDNDGHEGWYYAIVNHAC